MQIPRRVAIREGRKGVQSRKERLCPFRSLKYSAHIISMHSQIYTPYPHLEALPPSLGDQRVQSRLDVVAMLLQSLDSLLSTEAHSTELLDYTEIVGSRGIFLISHPIASGHRGELSTTIFTILPTLILLLLSFRSTKQVKS